MAGAWPGHPSRERPRAQMTLLGAQTRAGWMAASRAAMTVDRHYWRVSDRLLATIETDSICCRPGQIPGEDRIGNGLGRPHKGGRRPTALVDFHPAFPCSRAFACGSRT